MRRRLHDLLRRHHRFAQGTTEFFICEPRVRFQRPTEYAVMMGGLPPVVVTREQFVNLDRRLAAPGAVSLDALTDAPTDDDEDTS